jgi:phosphatidylserine/phosphatidylglycerophosphate/cardiolipin synthase-like enzyme
MLLQAGMTCWALEIAPRAALLLDMADYLTAARAAMSKARRSIHFLNWSFDPDTRFAPRPNGGEGPSDRFGAFLKTLGQQKPEIDIRILCWNAPPPIAVTQNFFPLKATACFFGSPVSFALDGALPAGASHHQKVIVIDDSVAFCGGADIGPDRWDTSGHVDDDPRRRRPSLKGRFYDSRHEVMCIVDGPPAAALGRLFRERWARATHETLPPGQPLEPGAWPSAVPVHFRDISVGLSRTSAPWREFPEVRQNEMLSLTAIANARRHIYIENQYLTSPVMAQALAGRLAEPDGPEVVLISTQRSPSYFDTFTMDHTRSLFLRQLKEADRFGRFHAYSPVTALGRPIIVHAKLAIIDEVLLRIGSSNLNNRSEGFDTECDLSLEASGPTAPASEKCIATLRTHILAHWLGCDDDVMATAMARTRRLGDAIESLRLQGYGRLRPLEPKPLGPVALFVAAFHIGDPISAADCWRPWKRRALLKAKRTEIVDLERRGPGAGAIEVAAARLSEFERPLCPRDADRH